MTLVNSLATQLFNQLKNAPLVINMSFGPPGQARWNNAVLSVKGTAMKLAR